MSCKLAQISGQEIPGLQLPEVTLLHVEGSSHKRAQAGAFTVRIQASWSLGWFREDRRGHTRSMQDLWEPGGERPFGSVHHFHFCSHPHSARRKQTCYPVLPRTGQQGLPDAGDTPSREHTGVVHCCCCYETFPSPSTCLSLGSCNRIPSPRGAYEHGTFIPHSPGGWSPRFRHGQIQGLGRLTEDVFSLCPHMLGEAS